MRGDNHSHEEEHEGRPRGVAPTGAGMTAEERQFYRDFRRALGQLMAAIERYPEIWVEGEAQEGETE